MKRFTLTNEHLTLLRAAFVGWDDCETGAPCIDPKRPYGNSNVESDIAEKLGWTLFEDADQHLSAEQRDRADTLHRETQEALQVILQLADIDPGDYAYDRRVGWFMVDDEMSAAATLRELLGES